jgi:hypothetical protein
VEGVARISWRSFATRTVLGRRSIRGRRFQRDNAFADAAFEHFIDVASRRLKLRRLHPQLRHQLLDFFSVSGDVTEFDIFVSAHDIR